MSKPAEASPALLSAAIAALTARIEALEAAVKRLEQEKLEFKRTKNVGWDESMREAG